MQGQCDPNVTNASNPQTWYPNCTADNNNATTGGVVQPTSTNDRIIQRSSDLSFILKPVYESTGDIKVRCPY